MSHIRNRRQAAGKTLTAVAREVGMDKAALSNVETGKRGLSVPALYRVAEAIGDTDLTAALKPYLDDES